MMNQMLGKSQPGRNAGGPLVSKYAMHLGTNESLIRAVQVFFPLLFLLGITMAHRDF